MSADAFRFVHATNLRLDQPLTGAGTLSADDRAVVEDATLTAFSRVVEVCLQHDASFLLLTGDCFEFQTGTLRGRLQMQRGLERLAEHDILTIIIPGSLDPPVSWKRGLTLPATTTLFTSDDDDAVEICRDGRTLASVAPIAMANSSTARPGEAGSFWRTAGPALRIGLVGAGSPIVWDGNSPEPAGEAASPAAASLVRAAIAQGVNYLALGEGAERQTISIAGGTAHDPGSPQGLNAGESGAKGCSLVEVSGQHEIEIRFMPTASVRWMSFAADAPTQVDLDQLAERLALVVMDSEPQETDDLWLIRWSIRGLRSEWNSTLSHLRSQAELWERVERELAPVGGAPRRHSLAGASRTSIERLGAIESETTKHLCQEFKRQVQADAEAALATLRSEVNQADWGQGGWVRHVRQTLQRTTSECIARRTCDLGEAWLS